MDYFTDAKSFYLNNTINASFTLDESVSQVGQCGGHGFAYAVLYGTVQKLLFGSEQTIIITNLALLIMCLLYLQFQPYSQTKKMYIGTCILSYFIVCTFATSYMVELLHISFILFSTIRLYNLYRIPNVGPERKKAVALFFLIILFFSLFRFTYSFFLLGLLPLAENKRTAVRYSMLFLMGIIFSGLYIRFYIAPNYLHPVHSGIYVLLHGEENRISGACSIITENVIAYFRHDASMPIYMYYYKYVLLLLPTLHIYFYLKTGNKLHLVPLLVSLCYLTTVFFLYTGEHDLNDLRHLSEVFILNSFFMIMTERTAVIYGLLLIAVLSLPQIHREVSKNTEQRLKYGEYFASDSLKGVYKSIASFKTEKKIITVQLPSRPYYDDLYFMPLISQDGKPIRYNMSYIKNPPDTTFITHYWNAPDK